MPHCPATRENSAGVGVHIREQFIDGREIVPMPMKAGSALFMTKETIHSSLRNTSDEVRISFDLRFNPIGQPTGREAFPGFVARSQERPETELHDAGSLERALGRSAPRAGRAGYAEVQSLGPEQSGLRVTDRATYRPPGVKTPG